MEKKLKRQWVKALRSGKFKQGLGQLFNRGSDGDRYCCLGVLCKIQGATDGWMSSHALETYLPAYGLDDKDIGTALANRNDATGDRRRRQSFKQIANYIEKHL